MILEKHQLTPFTHNYFDDIMIHSINLNTHLEHIDKVLAAFEIENIKLKLSKCMFAKTSVRYLGHEIRYNNISPLKDTMKAINEFPRPEGKKEVQRFLGKINFYRKFIPNATEICNPLYKLLRNCVKFEWSTECEQSFINLKKILTSYPVLRIYDPSKTNYLFTDASKVGIGAILKQEHEGTLHPIGYFSKKLLSYQLNYSITELECLAIVESVYYFHHYLYDNRFIVITDHMALKWLKTVKKSSSRLFKWSLKLSQYNFDIKYNPGKNHIEAVT